MAQHRITCGLAGLTLAALTACAPQGPTEPDLSGPELRALYAATAVAIKERGGLRTDRNPADAPLSVETLVRNFTNIAFFHRV